MYSELNDNLRLRSFEDIIAKIKSISNPLICTGDWNCFWFKEDKKGGDRISLRILARARNILDDSNLIDLGHSGPQFT